MAYSKYWLTRGGIGAFLFVMVSAECFAQANYYDYVPSQQTNLFYEDFNDNSYDWWAGSDQTTCYVSGGYYYMNTRVKSGTAWATKPFKELDTSRDFEIETSIQFVSGEDTYAHSLLFGHKDGDNHFKMGISGNTSYYVGYVENNKWNFSKDWKSADFVNKGGLNKLTIRKAGGYFYYFVNENFVFKEPFKPFYGEYIGFQVNHNSNIKIDYLRISYLKEPRKNVEINTALITGDRTKSKTIEIFNETFLNNDNNWWVGDREDVSAKIYYEYYQIVNKKGNDKSMHFYVPKKFKPSDNNDFIIETTLKFQSGYDNSGFGFQFGMDKETYNAFHFLITATQWYMVQVKRDGKSWVDLKKWTKADFIRPGGYNKLTIKKVDKTYLFYINEYLVHTAPYEPFFGSNLIYEMGKDLTVQVKDLNISYLSSDEDSKMIITEYLNKRIKKWQEKGKFETTQAYRERVSEESRSKLIQSLTEQVVDSLGKLFTSLEITKTGYDADNQTFHLYFKDNRSVYLPVPLADAPVFDKNLSRLKFEDASYAFTSDNEFILKEAWVYNPVNGKRYHYNSGQTVAFNTVDFALNFDPVEVSMQSNDITQNVIKGQRYIEVGKADVDVNIPETGLSNPDAIAVVIGNRSYSGDTPDVEYAVNDAKIVKEYLVKTLGFKPGNILYEENATRNRMVVLFGNEEIPGRLANYLKPGQSDVFVYYSGHGAPDPNTQTGYLMPVDADPTALSLTGYSLELLYDNLAKLPSKSVSVVIDACFSGASGDGGMLIQNASPIGIQVDNPAARLKNGFVVTASSGSQVASWYPEKGHGLLTYFWLKGLQGAADLDEDSQVTTSELKQYLSDTTGGVPYWARRLHNRQQMPGVYSGQDMVLVRYKK